MPQYALLTYHPGDPDWTAPDQADTMAEYGAFGAHAGDAIVGGAALFPTTTATSVRITGGPDGEVVVSDGPFAETKEVLGGLYLVEAADLDEAIEYAKRVPSSWHGTTEVRPLVPMPE